MIQRWKNTSMENISEVVDGVLRVEEWLPVNVPHFSEGFHISTFGRLKGLKKNHINKAYITEGGYLRTTITHEKVTNSFYLHVLVTNAFIPKPENLTEIELLDIQVNHKNGIKTDNRVWKLEWNTRSQNMLHAFKHGLNKGSGENHFRSKLTNKQALEIFHSKEKRKTLALKYNVNPHTIQNIKLGILWSDVTGKYHQYAENRTRGNLSNADVLAIFTSIEKPSILVKRYGISNVSIHKIRVGKAFTEVTKNAVKGEWSKYKKAA